MPFYIYSDENRLAPRKIQIDAYGVVGVEKIVCYPHYRSGVVYNDLALIKLKTPVELSSNIIPACLASNWTENLYDTLLQTGYGTSTYSGNLTRFIRNRATIK